MKRVAFALLFLVFCSAPISGLAAGEGEWITIPPEYARFKLSRFSKKVSPREYRIVVDVPALNRGETHIAKSSGSKPVDVVALDFADAYASQLPNLKAMHASKELRFSFLLDLRAPEATGWNTPKGRIQQMISSYHRPFGIIAMRIATGPDGRLVSAKMVSGAGSRRADAEFERFAMEHWSGPPNQTTVIRTGYYSTWSQR